jgi:glycosyltransferase involved in cell wall biosynthesis
MPIEVVTDADVIADYYRETWARETRTFPYGTDLFERGSFVERIERLGLKAGRYLLYVSRLEPENNALLLVRAFKHVRTDMPLVVVGDAPYSQEYVNLVKTEADPRVLFLGFRFGDDYHALESNAAIYVQATEVGGTHPALVEAMGHRNAIVAQDVPEHREVLGDAGSYFAYHDEAQLAAILQDLLDRPEAIADFRQRAAARVCKRYSWDAVTDEYEQYFLNLAEGR